MEGQTNIFDFLDRAEPEKLCRTCGHMSMCVSGPGEIFHAFGCFGFGISRSDDIDQKACGDYVRSTDGAAWRTSDKAVKKWLNHN